MQKNLWLLLFVPLFVACASFWQRKNCEKLNWFQVAYDTAMKGQRMEQNPVYKRCLKVETNINGGEVQRGFRLGMENYCKVEGARGAGMQGDSFNYDFCETHLHPLLKRSHAQGMDIFCQPETAIEFASRGGVYQNQCTDRNEPLYLKNYKKGRRSFLKAQILKNENAIQSIDGEIFLLRTSMSRSYDELSRVQRQIRDYNQQQQQQNQRPLGNASPDPYTSQDNNVNEMELGRINDDIERYERDISSKLDEQRDLRAKNIDLQAEIDRLVDL